MLRKTAWKSNEMPVAWNAGNTGTEALQQLEGRAGPAAQQYSSMLSMGTPEDMKVFKRVKVR